MNSKRTMKIANVYIIRNSVEIDAFSGQAGFSYVEYLVTTIACTLMVLFPIPGITDLSVFEMVMGALRGFGNNTDLLISLP